MTGGAVSGHSEQMRDLFLSRLAEDAEATNQMLDRLLTREAERGEVYRPKLLIEAMRYAALSPGKRRTMEIYLNVVEWGPNVFGAEAAARHYYRRSAKQLSLQQAALLAAALPNPYTRNPARPSRNLQAIAFRISARATQAGDYIKCLYP